MELTLHRRRTCKQTNGWPHCAVKLKQRPSFPPCPSAFSVISQGSITLLLQRSQLDVREAGFPVPDLILSSQLFIFGMKSWTTQPCRLFQLHPPSFVSSCPPFFFPPLSFLSLSPSLSSSASPPTFFHD